MIPRIQESYKQATKQDRYVQTLAEDATVAVSIKITKGILMELLLYITVYDSLIGVASILRNQLPLSGCRTAPGPAHSLLGGQKMEKLSHLSLATVSILHGY